MSLETAVVEWAKSDVAGVNALIGGRIYPLAAYTLGGPRPILTYEIKSGESLGTHNGPSAYQKNQVEFAIAADSYADCAGLSNALRKLMDGQKFIGIASGWRIVPAMLDDETDIEEQHEEGTNQIVYVRTMTFRMLHRDNTL